MGIGEFSERKAQIRAPHDLVRKPVRAADDESYPAHAPIRQIGDKLGKLRAGELLSLYAERDDKAVRARQEALSLSLPDSFHVRGARRGERLFLDLGQGKRAKTGEPLGVFGYPVFEIFFFEVLI